MTYVVDIGNSRIKWAAVVNGDALGPAATVESTETPSYGQSGDEVWMASVHPTATERLFADAEARGLRVAGRFASAEDVPVRHALARPERTGADRALIALMTARLKPADVRAVAVSCGTALTFERIAPDGTWQGGAIAPGLPLWSAALPAGTAQLPLVEISGDFPAWGDHTEPAIAAGIGWGLVGAIRELIARVGSAPDGLPPWVLWTGGDATWLGRLVQGPEALVRPDLVLAALAGLAS